MKEKKVIVTTSEDQASCLFCNQVAHSVDDNLAHMMKKHSFFVAAQEYCTNVAGLLKYLGNKINKGLMCLYCENAGTKGFHTREAL